MLSRRAFIATATAGALVGALAPAVRRPLWAADADDAAVALRERGISKPDAPKGMTDRAKVNGAARLERGRAMHFIERAGKGPTVLFVHGFGQSSVYWQDWVELLGQRGVHAVALDLPGFGGSARVPGPYAIESLSDAVAEFIRAHDLGAVALVGNSMGSTVAQHVALRHPALVQRLLLTAAGASFSLPVEKRKSPQEQRQYWVTRDAVQMVNGFFIRGEPPADHAAAFYAAARQMSVEAAIEADRSNVEWSTLDRLHEIEVPTLIIEGAHDRSRSPEQGAIMAAHLPHARLVVQANSAHTPQWDEPEAFRAAALPFLLEGR